MSKEKGKTYEVIIISLVFSTLSSPLLLPTLPFGLARKLEPPGGIDNIRTQFMLKKLEFGVKAYEAPGLKKLRHRSRILKKNY